MDNRLLHRVPGCTGPFRLRPMFVLAASLLLAACQTTVSLEEARRITASFEGTSFTPPPKTINDVIALLDQQKPADPEAVAKARETATREPPLGAKGDDLARFFWRRGTAAGRTGDVRRQIADLKKAQHHVVRADKSDILRELSFAEALGGNFADAIRHLEEASNSVYSESINETRAIEVETTLAVVYARSGDLDAAERKLRLAGSKEVIMQHGGRSQFFDLPVIDKSLSQAKAVIIDASGRYEEAESAYRSALEHTKDFLDRHVQEGSQRYLPPGAYERWHYEKDSLRSGLAMLLVRQGRLVEGELELRRALTDTLRRTGRYSSQTASMLRTLATIIDEQGRHAEAEKLVWLVLDLYEKLGAPGDSFELAKTYHQLAQVLVSQGQWKASLVVFDQIKTGLADDPQTFEKTFGGDLGWSLALLSTGRTAEGASIAEVALRRSLADLGEKHYRTALARGVLAMASANTDERKKALAGFAGAIPILLSRSRRADDETTSQTAREQRLGLILEAYIGLLADIRGTDVEREAGIDAAREAFRIAEVARSRSVQRALAASAARAAARDPELAELVDRI